MQPLFVFLLLILSTVIPCGPGYHPDEEFMNLTSVVKQQQTKTLCLFGDEFSISLFYQVAPLAGPHVLLRYGSAISITASNTLTFGFQGCSIQAVAPSMVWNRVTARFSSSSHTIELFVNETLQASSNCSLTSALVPGQFDIGTPLETGAVMHVRVFNRIISLSEMYAIQNNTLPSRNMLFYSSLRPTQATEYSRQLSDLWQGDGLLGLPGDKVESSVSPLCFPESVCFPNPCGSEICVESNLNFTEAWISPRLETKQSNVRLGYECRSRGLKCGGQGVEFQTTAARFIGHTFSAPLNGIFEAELAISFWAKVDNKSLGLQTIVEVNGAIPIQFGFDLNYLSLSVNGTLVRAFMDCSVESFWHFYVASISNGEIRIFFDGYEVAYRAIDLQGLTFSMVQTTVGSSTFVGALANVQLFGNSFTAAVVSKLYEDGDYGSNAPLFWLPFGSSGALRDRMGNITLIGSGEPAPLTGPPLCISLLVVPGSFKGGPESFDESGIRLVNSSDVISFEVTFVKNFNGWSTAIDGNVTGIELLSPAARNTVLCDQFSALNFTTNGGHFTLMCKLPSVGGLEQFQVRYCIDTECSTSQNSPNDPQMTQIRYTPPIITPFTLRRFDFSSLASDEWLALTDDPETFEFRGSGFLPSDTILTFGPPDSPDSFSCTIDVAKSEREKLVFNTSKGFGSGLVFQIDVRGSKVTGTDQYHYRTLPTVTHVSGCEAVGCPTAGGGLITIAGTSFFQPPEPQGRDLFSVEIGGVPCSNPEVVNLTHAYCILPEGAGGIVQVRVTSFGLQSLASSAVVRYAPPKVFNISAASCITVDSLHLKQCARENNAVNLTISGVDFGTGPWTVLVGSQICENASALVKHVMIECSLPSGTTLQQPVMVLSGGQRSEGAAIISYMQCPAGEYEENSDKRCVECPAGKFSGLGAINECEDCPPGTISFLNGSANCTKCPLDKYQESPGKTMCDTCSPGEVPFNGNTCRDCEPGTYSKNGSECVACEIGKFSRAAGSSSCQFCQKGWVQPATTQSDCTRCAGSQYAHKNMTSCATCPNFAIGAVEPSNTSSDGNTFCECKPGYYAVPMSVIQNVPRSIAPQILKNLETAAQQPNYAWVCVTCPEGAACKVGGQQLASVQALSGYVRDAGETNLQFFQCPEKDVCLPEGCADGYQGPLCGSCREGYGRGYGYFCAECPALGVTVFGFVAVNLVLLALVVIFVWRARAGSLSPVIKHMIIAKIFLTGMQINSIALSMRFRFSTYMRSLLAFQLGIAQIGSTLLSWDCARGTTPMVYQKTLFFLFLPLLSFVGCCIGARISMAIKRKGYSVFWSYVISSFVPILVFTHPNLTSQAFVLFNCIRVGISDDDMFLASDLSVRCYTAEYWPWLLLVGLPLLIQVFAIPIVLFTYLYRFRASLVSDAFMLKFAFLYKGYKERMWFWEGLVMLRKMVMIAIGVFFKTDVRIQSLLAVLICVCSLGLHSWFQPFSAKMLHYYELFSLICSCSLFYLTQFLSPIADGDVPIPGQDLSEAVIFISQISFLLAGFALIFSGFRKRCRTYVSKHNVSKMSVELEPSSGTEA